MLFAIFKKSDGDFGEVNIEGGIHIEGVIGLKSLIFFTKRIKKYQLVKMINQSMH